MCPDERSTPPEVDEELTDRVTAEPPVADGQGLAGDSGTSAHAPTFSDVRDTWSKAAATLGDPGHTLAGLTLDDRTDTTDSVTDDAGGRPRYRSRQADGAPEVIGQGALGRVVVVWDEQLRRPVARKELMRPDSLPATVRFQREARITALMEHPGVIPVHDMGRTQDGVFYYTMKWVQGITLREAIDQAADLPARRALLPSFIDLCECIAYAHTKGVIHRDIKPDNTMVGPFGETVVIDWGIARVDNIGEPLADDAPSDDARMTRVGAVVGTPYYMSPEQAAGESVDARSDIWALGMVLCEIVSGQLPHSGTSDQVMAQLRLGAEIQIPKQVPSELASVIERALALRPQDRYATASELASEVQDWLAGERVGAHAYSTPETILRLARRHRNAVSVGLIAVIALLVTGVVASIEVVRERDAAKASAALARHQRNEANAQYAASLEQAAHRALSESRHGEARLLAAKALSLHETPAAWGVLTATTSVGIPQLQWTADHDRCWTTRLSPDGRHLACTRPGEVLVWSTVDHQLVHRLPFEGPGTHALAWSPSGRRVASGRNPAVVVWDVGTGAEVGRIDTENTGTWSIRFVDEDHVVAGLNSGDIVHFDLARAQRSAVWKGHTERVISLAVSPPWIASGSGDGTTRLWRLDEGTHRILPHPAAGASTVEFSADGLVLATGGARGDASPMLHLWDPQSGALLKSIETGAKQPQDAAWSSDGRWLIVGTRDGVLRIHRAKTGALIHQLVIPDEIDIKSVAIGNGQLYAQGNWGRPRLWSLPEDLAGFSPVVPSSHPVDLCWRTDGRRYQGVLRERQWAQWDAITGDLLATRPLEVSVDLARCDVDGAFLFASGSALYATDPQGMTHLTGDVGSRIRFLGNPGGRYLSTRSGHVLTQVGSGAPVQSAYLGEEVWEMAGNPSGGEVIVSVRNTPHLWRLDDQSLELRETVQVKGTIQAQSLPSMSIQPGGQVLVGGTAQGEIVLYDTETLNQMATDSGEGRWILRIVWAPDGQRFAVGTAGGNLRVYDASGTRLLRLPLSNRLVAGLAFSADGTQLAISTADGVIRRLRLGALDEEASTHLERAQQVTGMNLKGTSVVFQVAGKAP